MEDVLKKLDLRTSRIEQIVPTLATKTDLQEVKTHLAVRIEAVEEKLGTIAEHLADFSQRLPPRA